MQWLPGVTASEASTIAGDDHDRDHDHAHRRDGPTTSDCAAPGKRLRLEFFLPPVLNFVFLILMLVTLWAAPAQWSVPVAVGAAGWSAWWFSYWRRRGVAQLLPLPPYGDAWGCVLLARDIGAQLRRLCGAGPGPALGAYLLGRRALLAVSPRAAAAALRALRDHGLSAGVPQPRGLFHQEGATWLRSRKLLLPAFSGDRLRAIFHQSLQPAAERLSRRLVSSCRRRGATVTDVHRLSCDFAAEVIAEAVLGLRRPPGEQHIPALEELRAWISRRLRPPLWRFMPTALALMAPGVARLLPQGHAPPPDFLRIMALVEEANAQAGDCAPRHDIADHLQKLRDEGLMSGTETSVHAMLMFSGAMEATASALAYCLLELALNPGVQRRLRAELRAAAGQQGRPLPFDTLAGLPYLCCVALETLRKHPPLAMLNRVVPEEAAAAAEANTVLSPELGCHLEPGTAVVVPLTVLHHDPRIFPQPERFQPERFTLAEAQQRHPCAFLPFGGGPRTCIGKRLGLLLMKAAVAELLLHFQLQACEWTESQPAAEPWAPVLVPQGGIWLRFSPLQDDGCDHDATVASSTLRLPSNYDEDRAPA